VPAASVILLRDARYGFQVFMARRHIKSDFAPDVYVFPGGKADPEDAVEGDHIIPKPPRELASTEPPAVGWVAIHMAAIRELFEETGVLLARGHSSSLLDPGAAPLTHDRLAAYRDQVKTGHLTMRDVADRESLVYTADQLCLFSNWITPEMFTRRFDTFFFLARLPGGEDPRHADLHELSDSLWIAPRVALDFHTQGRFPLVFATERILMRLSAAGSINELWAAAETSPVETISPRWTMREGEQIFLIPGDAGYEAARTR
jgi:8-oxo-dGTP pyrophosphatase MutT (NUDIX family)